MEYICSGRKASSESEGWRQRNRHGNRLLLCKKRAIVLEIKLRTKKVMKT